MPTDLFPLLDFEWSAMKQTLNWKDCDNLNFQYFCCLLKMANGITYYECPMRLTNSLRPEEKNAE